MLQVGTLLTSFIVPLPEIVDEGGRIHASLNINTETGRLVGCTFDFSYIGILIICVSTEQSQSEFTEPTRIGKRCLQNSPVRVVFILIFFTLTSFQSVLFAPPKEIHWLLPTTANWRFTELHKHTLTHLRTKRNWDCYILLAPNSRTCHEMSVDDFCIRKGFQMDLSNQRCPWLISFFSPISWKGGDFHSRTAVGRMSWFEIISFGNFSFEACISILRKTSKMAMSF